MTLTMLDLKADARADSAEFPPFLANHLPMILVALERLGASPDRLLSFDRAYRAANGLCGPPQAELLAPRDWLSLRGERGREGCLRRFFDEAIGRDGAEATIRAALPDLAPGIAGSAFHPLMRLAYGVMERDEAEIGIALAFWAATYLPLGAPGAGAGLSTDPAEILRRAAGLAGVGEAVPESDLVWHNMRAVAAVPSFAGVGDWLIVEADTLDGMAAASLALFAGTMSFEALHAVTGCHWLRLLQPVAPDMAPLLRHFWTGIAALMPKMGFPVLPSATQLEEWRQAASPGWPQIKDAAIRSDDEHDHSLVFSACEEWGRTGDPLYRVVAARRVGLIA